MKKPIEEREEEFRQHVYDVGGAIYTKLMLDRFISSWTEPDRGRGISQKMKFEKESTWNTSRRLATWARNNYDNIVCYLTDSQKTIQVKKKEFAVALEPFLPKYGKDLLNAFYRHWAQPENVPNPQRLRWELEEFWDLAARLQSWASKPHNQPQQNNQYYARR
jgi:hypothetical protein